MEMDENAVGFMYVDEYSIVDFAGVVGLIEIVAFAAHGREGGRRAGSGGEVE